MDASKEVAEHRFRVRARPEHTTVCGAERGRNVKRCKGGKGARGNEGKRERRKGPPNDRIQATFFLYYITWTLTYSPCTTGTPFTMETPAIHAACVKPQDHSAAAR